ncbi:MAG: hypothetical protein AAGH92_07770 [Planctomycetota bacterium]
MNMPAPLLVAFAVLANVVALPYIDQFARSLKQPDLQKYLPIGLVVLLLGLSARLLFTRGQATSAVEASLMIVVAISATQFFLSFARQGGIPLEGSVPWVIGGVLVSAMMLGWLGWLGFQPEKLSVVKAVGVVLVVVGAVLANWK